MDGQQYLNQIAESNRPVKQAGGSKGGLSKILTSKFFIVGAVGVGLLVLILIIGAVLGGSKKDEKSLDIDLLLHVNNTTEVVSEYKDYVKSSPLRSSAASLQSVLKTTSEDLTKYMEDKYKFKTKNIDKKVSAAATKTKEKLTNELFEAKINGILDRIFAHKMAYEITMILTEEERIGKSTTNDTLKSLLNKSEESLNTLYSEFNDYSEAK